MRCPVALISCGGRRSARLTVMPITERVLIRQYGQTAAAGNAALFVGAGLSRSAGYPDWSELLDTPRQQADIPNSVTDLPLVAEYYVRNVPGGREALESHVLESLSRIDASPGPGHANLIRLPVDDIWTTNYDCLIEHASEAADRGLSVVTSERDFRQRSTSGRRLVKMHGSMPRTAGQSWVEQPTITRKDYEEYEITHQRTWAALRAAYLTRSFLFLGFSFLDPNIEVLLRLARTIGDIAAPEHYTVLKRPEPEEERRSFELRVQDLEYSGIAVTIIESYDDLDPLLARLVRRTRTALNNRRAFRGLAGWVCETFRHAGYERARA